MGSTAWGLGSSLLLVAPPVAAGPAGDAPPHGLEYRADATCLDAASFTAIVRQRAPSVQLEPADADHADILVALHAKEGGFAGNLEIRRRDRTRYVRELRAASCDDVGPAIAFILALALNGQAEPASEVPEPPPRSAPPSLAETAPKPAPTVGTPAGWGWAFAAEVGARTGIAPSAAFIERVAIEARALTDSTFAPTFRIAMLRTETVTQNDSFGTTDFTWLAARVAGCPVRARLGGGAELLPCAGVDVGAIGASGKPTTPQGRDRATNSFWTDAFTSLRLQLPLFGPVFALTEAELVWPLTKYDFAFDPLTPVYAVPSLGIAGSAGLAAQFK